MIVVDASVWVRALVDDGPVGGACRTVLAGESIGWPRQCPHRDAADYPSLRRAGLLTTEQATAHAQSVLDAEVRYSGAEHWILATVWQHRHTISHYDVPYVALALAVGSRW